MNMNDDINAILHVPCELSQRLVEMPSNYWLLIYPTTLISEKVTVWHKYEGQYSNKIANTLGDIAFIVAKLFNMIIYFNICIFFVATERGGLGIRTNRYISETALPITETTKRKTHCNRKYPPKPRKTHLRNHFWPLESGFSAIATYKTRVFSKPSNGPILKFFLVVQLFLKKFNQFLGHLALFYFWGVVKDCCALPGPQKWPKNPSPHTYRQPFCKKGAQIGIFWPQQVHF